MSNVTNKHLLDTVESLLDTTKDGFKGMGGELNEFRSKQDSYDQLLLQIVSEQKLDRNDLERILKVIDGNGVEALSVRLAKFETVMEQISKQITEAGLRITRIEEELKSQQKQTIEKLWDIVKPLLMGALGAGGALLGTGAM